MENPERKSLFEDRQNLQRITRITATHVRDVAAVLAVMQGCETITLTDDQVKMGMDIDGSILEHGVLRDNVARVSYLIRYGMLLERENVRLMKPNKEAAPGAVNTEGGKAEPQNP